MRRNVEKCRLKRCENFLFYEELFTKLGERKKILSDLFSFQQIVDDIPLKKCHIGLACVLC